MLSRAVRVEVTARAEDGGVRVRARLRPGAIGHAFPTGDLFRRAELRIGGAEGHSLFYQRFFALMPASSGNGFTYRQVDDTRVGPEGSLQELVIPNARLSRLPWTLSLHRLDPETARRRGLPPARTTTLVARGITRVERPR